MNALLMMMALTSAANAAGFNLSPGARLDTLLPPEWNEEAKSAENPGFVMLNVAGSIDTCSFRGGAVTVKKVEAGQVIFAPADGGKGRCAQLTTSVERFKEWEPAVAKAKTAELEKRHSDFQKALMEDVQKVVDQGADPCQPEDSELKVDGVYKLGGRVFLYGNGTTATNLAGRSCQMELGALTHVIGFSRASDFAVAVYRQPAGSKGKVLTGPQRTETDTCRDQDMIAFSLSKLKRHFEFSPASMEEKIKVKGLASLFKGKRGCANDASGENKNAAHSAGAKAGSYVSSSTTDASSAGKVSGQEGSAE